MDWLVGLLLLIVGGVIGFFVAKYVKNEAVSETEDVQNEQTLHEIMSQQATQHVQESKQILENLLGQTHSLKQQIENYEQLLISQNSGAEGSSLNYYGEHASAYLRNQSKTASREKAQADVQPLDFSSQSSGLFSGSEDNKVKDS
ncbi:ZapG family protein [Paraglaciecola aestuariivivens]